MADRVVELNAQSNISNEAIAAASVELSKLQRSIDEAVGLKRAAIKRQKADGMPIEALLGALKLRRLDNDDARKKIRDLLRCALVIAPDLPLRQDDLFDRNADFDISERAGALLNEEEAFDRGYNAGLNGGSIDDSPFAAGTPYFERYREGYMRGQAAIAARMGENAEVASTSRRKPRRENADAAA